MDIQIKQKKHKHSPVFSLSNKLLRLLWAMVYIIFFRFSPVPLFAYRNAILRLFGAKISCGVRVYPSVQIWWPANLNIGSSSSVGPSVRLYNQGKITILEHVVISQGAYLCASTHDYNNVLYPLILAPIFIGAHVWVCTEAFIGPYVKVAEGCVIGARSVLTKSTDPDGVYAGNPARKIKERILYA